MGEMYINDIVGHHLPNNLKRSLNTAKLLTNKTIYEIMVDALEKYLNELGITEHLKEKAEMNFSGSKFQSWEKEGFCYHYQRIRLESQV